MSLAAIHAARAAAGMNNLASKFNETVFGKNKDRYINLCGLKAKIGRFWYGEKYVFNEDYCKNLLETIPTSSSFKRKVDDMLGLKSTGTFIAAAKKGPKGGAVEILKSITGLDNKEMADDVRRLLVLVRRIHDKVMDQSPPMGSVSPPSEAQGGGGGEEEGGAAEDGD